MSTSDRQTKGHTCSPESEFAKRRREELKQVVADLRREVRTYGITPEQLFGPDLSDLVRYRNPDTGQTWGGFGRPPNWIRGQDRNRFRVD